MSTVRAAMIAFAAYHLVLALFMAIAPHAFFTDVGPFGARNDHYVRDVATYNAALGVGFLIAFQRRSWRVPVLVITLVQFALRSSRAGALREKQDLSRPCCFRAKDGMSRDLLSSSAEDPRRYQTVELEEAPYGNRNGT